jgi:hypothetical protein
VAQPVTLQELRDRALDYADMSGSDFPNLARLDNYIRVGLSKLHNILINAYQDYYRETQTITLVAGQETYDLPSDFAKSLEMFKDLSNRRYKIPKFSRGEISGYRQGSLTGGTVTHWYAPQMTPLRLPTDKVHLSVPLGWEDYVALVAGVRLLVREESDPSALMAERDAARLELIEMAEPRDEGDQGKVEDIYGRYNRAADHLREWRYLRYRIMGNKVHFYEFEYMGT